MPGSYTNNTIGEPFIKIDSIASTNNYAMELVNKGLGKHGMVIFADEQTAGKGQRGKQWHSATGENIILSVILNTSGLQVSNQFALSIAIALAAYDFFYFYAGTESSVKWPNDLFWRDRKAGGILIENTIAGQEWQWAVVGIGININQTAFAGDTGKPVSLKQITGKTYPPADLAKELCGYIEKRYQHLLAGYNETQLEEYNKVLYKKGQRVTLKKGNIVFDCIIAGVNKYGGLITESAPGQTFSVGEIQWVI